VSGLLSIRSFSTNQKVPIPYNTYERPCISGFLIHGPLCHYWLEWTEDNLSFNGAIWATPIKVKWCSLTLG